MSAAGLFGRLFGKLTTRAYRRIEPAEAAELIGRGAVLVDVREPHEWRAGHAPKARHIPLSQLDSRSRELPSGRLLITVCRSGARASRAAARLAAGGREVANISGGMRAWARSGLPVKARGGGAGRIV